MEIMYNEDGKAFVPATDFYKDLIITQIHIAVDMDDREAYDEHICRLLLELELSDYYKAVEPSFKKEVMMLVRMPFESMKKVHADRNAKYLKKDKSSKKPVKYEPLTLVK